jgi:hypothetical protein
MENKLKVEPFWKLLSSPLPTTGTDHGNPLPSSPHQQKIKLLVSTYKSIYIDRIILNPKFQVDKYMPIEATKKAQDTARNVIFTVHAMVCEGMYELPRIQEDILDHRKCRLYINLL